MNDVLRTWPRRRWLVTAAAFPAMTALFAATGRAGQAGGGTPWWTWPWLVIISILAATVLASYLAPPGAGKLIEAGCSPCAAAAALAVAGAVMAHASAPSSPFMAAVAMFLTALAVRQRLTDARACPTAPSAPPPPGPLPPAAGPPA